MTEQNYEEQAAEAAAAAAAAAARMEGVQEAAVKDEGQPKKEEPEDDFHINLDFDD